MYSSFYLYLGLEEPLFVDFANKLIMIIIMIMIMIIIIIIIIIKIYIMYCIINEQECFIRYKDTK